MTENPGLYVHIPFCSVKCFYCDFAAVSGQKATARRYLAALSQEASLRGSAAPSTLYIGGGTPSELGCDEIQELFALLRRAYPGAEFSEVTFEGNPESLDQEKIELLRSLGVTRLSCGLQTADDALLKGIGRRHTFAEFADVFRRARALPGWALSVDLMFGLPGQTLASLRDTLDKTLELEPEHVSIYGLHVEDRTVFARRGVEPDEDEGREMFELILARLPEAGLRHYEISNFARLGFESRHNLNYWDNGEYIGLGCGAASHVDGSRWTNVDRLLEYCRVVEEGRRPSADIERAEGLEKIGERAFLGLRRVDGFDVDPELETAFAESWARLAARGLVERRGPRARLTRDGLFLANDAFKEFVPPFVRTMETLR